MVIDFPEPPQDDDLCIHERINIRSEALQSAIDIAPEGTPADKVIADAKAFEAYINGDGGSEIVSQ